MAYDHKDSKDRSYHLNSKDIKLKSTGRVQNIFHINRTVQGDPSINPKTGLPLLLTDEERKKKFRVKEEDLDTQDGWSKIKGFFVMVIMMLGLIFLFYLWGLFVQSW